MMHGLETSETIKDSLRTMLMEYKGHLMPVEQVKQVLDAEIPKDVELSEELVAMRRGKADIEDSYM